MITSALSLLRLGNKQQEGVLSEDVGRRTYSTVRHDEDENFGDNYFVITFNRDLVRADQDEVYIYAT